MHLFMERYIDIYIRNKILFFGRKKIVEEIQ